MGSDFELRLARFLLGSDAPPPCDHAPISCVPDPDNIASCLVQQLSSRWMAEPKPFFTNEHPLVFSLWQAGCERYVAQYLASGEGFGMKAAPNLVDAFKKVGADERTIANVAVCDQCRPSTNTWAYCFPYRDPTCRRVPVRVIDFARKLTAEEKVLCIGRDGALKYCSPNEFIAVSHVWAHGWQGTSEDGLCSRVLNMLLDVASHYGVNWIWLDVAMISKEKISRSMAINSMDLVYSTAKVTVVCDRLLLNFKGGNDRETALAIAATDWMTRVWTMQEAMLSQNLVMLSRFGTMEPRVLMDRMIRAKHDADRWQGYRAIKVLCAMVHDKRPSLQKVVALSLERLTTKAVDMVRALFPLFSLKWPGPDTTLIQGQIMLLKHLGEEASQLTGLNGPFGLPHPWNWAPMCIPGTSGAMCGPGRLITDDGLMGAWSWREVQPAYMETPNAVRGRNSNSNGWLHFKNSFRQSRDYRGPPGTSLFDFAVGVGQDLYKSAVITKFANWPASSHGIKIAELFGMQCVYSTFKATDNGEEFRALLTFNPNDAWPWSGQRMFFIASADISQQERNANLKIIENGTYYDLVVVESGEGGWFVMRRVGKVVTMGVTMHGGKKESIQGVLH